jgi:hypothetical protein
VVPQNMTGAGGFADDQLPLHSRAKDGLSIGMIANASGDAGRRYPRRAVRRRPRCNGLAPIAPGVETMAVWHTTGVKSIEDARQPRGRRRRLGSAAPSPFSIRR